MFAVLRVELIMTTFPDILSGMTFQYLIYYIKISNLKILKLCFPRQFKPSDIYFHDHWSMNKELPSKVDDLLSLLSFCFFSATTLKKH